MVDKHPGVFRAEITKDTFKGNWPFKVDKAEIINNNGAILAGLWYKKFFKEKYCIFAINGTALAYMEYFKAKELPMYLQNSPNKNSVSDVIRFGMELNPGYKG